MLDFYTHKNDDSGFFKIKTTTFFILDNILWAGLPACPVLLLPAQLALGPSHDTTVHQSTIHDDSKEYFLF